MSFAQENGYIPSTISDLMGLVRLGVNEQLGTDYDAETFLGTNLYKYFYALIQRLQANEVKTSEIFLKLQQYFDVTNELITRPNTTHPGIRDYLTALGYLISTKAPLEADAGKIFICVDELDNHARGMVTISSYANLVSGTHDSVTVGATVFTAQTGAATAGTGTFRAATSNAETASSLALQINAHATAGALVYAWAVDAVVHVRAIAGGTAGNAIALAYTNGDANVGASVSGATLLGGYTLATDEDDFDDRRLEICTAIKDSVVAGVISQGSEIETITLSNDQSFDFKFNLPTRIPILLRLTLVTSDNNQSVILSIQETTAKLFANINARYRLGLDFEPQRYFSVLDAPWARSVLLEWSENGGSNYYSTVRELEYNELFTFALADIEVVES
jgi:hypothetical protein